MKFNIWWLGIVVVTLCGVPARSHAFDIQLTQEQVKEANVYGAQYKGKEIFESPIGKSACFGEYPGGNGGFIMSMRSIAFRWIPQVIFTPAQLRVPRHKYP